VRVPLSNRTGLKDFYMATVMTKKEKKILMSKMSGVQTSSAPKRARRARNKTRPARNPVQRAGPPGPRRSRGKRGKRVARNNQVTTAGNMRSFVIPIDEQIQVVNGTTGFGIATFAINPGNPACFPFASRTAQNYERYEFQSLRFEYKPSASVFATVGAQGFVGVTGTMDALQATPSSQAQAEVMHHSPIVETARPTGLTFPKAFLETKSARECFFVRPNGSIPGGADPHLYDCGQAFFWTNGQANTNQIGELRVIGSCKLINPVLETSTNPAPQFQQAVFSEPSNTNVFASTNDVVLALATVGANPLAIVNTAGQFVPPVGTYSVSGQVNFVMTGNVTVFSASIEKNGVVVPSATAGLALTTLPSGAYANWSSSIPPVVVSCNGTDAITLHGSATFSTGAATCGGFLTFEAI